MTATTAIHAAPCGCQHPQGTCCTLDCLEKPFFSCGQLLTDQDLMALVTWTQKKTGLARYRHGWGVACGLEVRGDPNVEGQVIVGPGYAVSCCGDDIVVCQDASVNLAPCCQQEADPCAGKAPPPAKEEGVPESYFGGLAVTGVRAVDLYVHYKEEGGSPRTALGGNNCRHAGACEDTRTKETFRIECKIGVAHADPGKVVAAKWEEDYAKCLEVVRRFRAEAVGDAHGEHIYRWLSRWIADNPPREFGFVKDLIQHHGGSCTHEMAAKVLFWLVQDCRNAFLKCGCYSCAEDSGTPLARVWVRTSQGTREKSPCRVLSIDSQPPFRRPMQLECWPAPMGHTNLGQVIWRRPNDAAALLARQGIRLAGIAEWEIPDSAAALEQALSGSLSVQWDSVHRLHVFDAGTLGFRVVGAVH